MKIHIYIYQRKKGQTYKGLDTSAHEKKEQGRSQLVKDTTFPSLMNWLTWTQSKQMWTLEVKILHLLRSTLKGTFSDKETLL